MGGHALQQGAEVFGQSVHHLRLEERGAVLPGAHQRAVHLRHRQGEIELHMALLDADGAQLEPTQRYLHVLLAYRGRRQGGFPPPSARAC